jgi:hypothetical protein
LSAYRERCKNLNLDGGDARIVFERRLRMQRGDAETVTAAVTLNLTAPPETILRRVGAQDEPGLVVSCNVSARLVASKYEFKVDETRWITRSLLTADTARWSWFVTPKIGGDHEIRLEFRPILAARPEDPADIESAQAEDFDIRPVDISVHVDVAWDEWLNEQMSRLARTFKTGEGMVKAMTVLVVALTALGAALGIKRKKNKRSAA